MARGTLYEAAGGQAAFLALAAAHHQRCLEDPELNHPFSHPGHPEHIERLAAYWGEVFGGPAAYSAVAGGHSSMLELHARTGAGADFGPRFVACFVQAMDDAGFPADPQLRTALRDYMEWAVQEVLAYSPSDSSVPVNMATPRWGWSGRE